jgi:cation transport regulator ChaC
MFYFAYGPNMNTAVLKERGVPFQTVCRGKIRDMRLVFDKPGEDGTGMADLQDHKGSMVEGVIYDVPENSLDNLDLYEGVDRGHYRRQAVVAQTARGEVECVTYRAAKFRTGLKPSPDHMQAIIRGAEEHRLSSEYRTFLKSFNTEAPAG